MDTEKMFEDYAAGWEGAKEACREKLKQQHQLLKSLFNTSKYDALFSDLDNALSRVAPKIQGPLI